MPALPPARVKRGASIRFPEEQATDRRQQVSRNHGHRITVKHLMGMPVNGGHSWETVGPAKAVGGGPENHEEHRDHPCSEEKRTEAELEEN